MLHHHIHDEANEAHRPIDLDQSDPEAVRHLTDDRIEEYLDRVCAPLVGRLARGKREEIRARVRHRLEQFATAHRELGSNHDEAIDFALSQCGNPELISARWLPATAGLQKSASIGRLKLLDRLLGSAKWSTGVSLLTFGVPYLAYITNSTERWWTIHVASTNIDWVPFYRVNMFVVPLLAGVLTGVAAKYKPTRGVLNALALMTLPALVLPGFLGGLTYAHVILNDQTNLGFMPNPLPALCGLVPWFALGCLGAGFGSRLRKASARIVTRIRRNAHLRDTGTPHREHGVQFRHDTSLTLERICSANE